MKIEKLAVFGAVAGVVTSFILKYVMMLLNLIAPSVPDISIKLANPTLALNIRESITGLNMGLGTWLMDNLGLTAPANMLGNVAMTALGGALFFIVGGWAAEQLKYLGAKNRAQKGMAIIFLGSLAAGLVLGGVGLPKELTIQAGVTFANVLIAFLVNAGVLAFVYSLIDKELGTNLVPF